MEWSDDAIILSVRPHGETSAIVEAFTHTHGRHMGLVRGGGSRRSKPTLQPGNSVHLLWRARLSEHLGNYSIEPMRARAGEMLESRDRLLGLNAFTAIASAALPEREPHDTVYEAAEILLDAILTQDFTHWASLFVRWEAGLLEALGFGLDLSQCAATGSLDDLAYVSPKSGRAVSAQAGEPYRDRMFRLPGFLLGSQNAEPSMADIAEGLRLTEYFLLDRVLQPHGREVPPARLRLNERANQIKEAI
ncbi:MAG TPA: DNA repair protein RecO [Rhizomicrobium sp.]|jgi:DNA repair protein RecO (recombination protein O)|nr:DNA repair protein RecO [Rhizomicrobium sp.]